MPDIDELRDELYRRMQEEQDRWRDWLVGQPAIEILNHAYQYSVREDILMAVEELDLSEKQVKALLQSPCPLADIYKAWQKVETHHMEDIRDVIENHADDAITLAKERSQRSEGR